MLQEERNLWVVLLEEEEKQERAELAEQQSWQANMVALNPQVPAALSAGQRNGISLPQAGLGAGRSARHGCVASPKWWGNPGWAGLGRDISSGGPSCQNALFFPPRMTEDSVCHLQVGD